VDNPEKVKFHLIGVLFCLSTVINTAVRGYQCYVCEWRLNDWRLRVQLLGRRAYYFCHSVAGRL